MNNLWFRIHRVTFSFAANSQSSTGIPITDIDANIKYAKMVLAYNLSNSIPAMVALNGARDTVFAWLESTPTAASTYVIELMAVYEHTS